MPGYLGPAGDLPKQPTKFAFKAGTGKTLFSEAPVMRGGVRDGHHSFREEARGVKSWHPGGAADLLKSKYEWLPNPPKPKPRAEYGGRFRVGRPPEPKPRTAPPEPYEDTERCRREIELGIRRPQTSRNKPFSSSTVPKPLFHDAPALRPLLPEVPARSRSAPAKSSRPRYTNKSDYFGPYPEHIPDPQQKTPRAIEGPNCMVSCWTTSGVSRSIMIK